MPPKGQDLPPGVAIGRLGVEATRLMKRINALCFEHRVNSLHDLPAGSVFDEAMSAQGRIDQIRHEQRAELRARALRGLAKAHANAPARRAARLNRFRHEVATRGGLCALNKTKLARDLGVARATVYKWCRRLQEEAAGPTRCPTCDQVVPDPKH